MQHLIRLHPTTWVFTCLSLIQPALSGVPVTEQVVDRRRMRWWLLYYSNKAGVWLKSYTVKVIVLFYKLLCIIITCMYVSWLRSAKSSRYTWWGRLGIQHLRLQCCDAQGSCWLYGIERVTCVSFCLSHAHVISGTALISISWKSWWPNPLILSWVQEEMVNRLPEHNCIYWWFVKGNFELSDK